MTRPTRMLLVLGVFAVAALAVLSLMAQRYGKLQQRLDAPPAGPAAPAAETASGTLAAPGAGPAEERALRYVDAFLAVRRAVRPPGDGAHSPSGATPLGEGDETLDRALAEAGLDRVTYEGLLEIYEAWKAGRSDLSGPLPDAFETRRAELERLE